MKYITIKSLIFSIYTITDNNNKIKFFIKATNRLLARLNSVRYIYEDNVEQNIFEYSGII